MRGPAAGQGGRSAGRLRQAHAVRRHASTSTIEKERMPRKEKFRQGFLDVPEIERPEWGVSFTADADDSDEVHAPVRRTRFQFPLTADITNWYLGFNMLDPVVGNGGTPEQREATASCARRSRSRSTGKRATAASSATRAATPRTARCRRACSARASSTPRVPQPGHAPRRQTASIDAPPDRRREAAARRGRLPRRPRRRRPAGRWCSTTTSSAPSRRSSRPRTTGWSSSSPRSASSSRSAPPTSTSSRTRR